MTSTIQLKSDNKTCFLIILFVMFFAQCQQSFQFDSFRVTFNSSTDSWQDFYISYCGRVCQNDTLVGLSKHCINPECFPCECDPLCSIYGVCCPSVDADWQINQTLQSISKEVEDLNALLGPERFKCETFTLMYTHYFMISDCPKHQNLTGSGKTSTVSKDYSGLALEAIDDKTREMCEKPDENTIEGITPYLDVKSGVTFRNKFCAMCNGYTIKKNDTNAVLVKKTSLKRLAEEWKLELSCSHYQNIYNVTSQLDFFYAAHKEILCNVQFLPPESKAEPRECKAWFHENQKVVCTNEDPVLDHYCHNLSENYLKVDDGRNLFCHMCTEDVLLQQPCPIAFDLDERLGVPESVYEEERIFIPQSFPVNNVPPISLLLGLTTRKKHSFSSEDSKCPLSLDWLSEQGECQPAECSAGKEQSDGQCSSVLKQIRGLGYMLKAMFTPQQSVTISESRAMVIADAFYAQLAEFSSDSIFEIDMVATANISADGERGSEVLQRIYLFTLVAANESLYRDDFETAIIEVVGGKLNLEIFDGETITLKTMFIGTEFYEQQIGDANKNMTEVSFNHVTTSYSRSFEVLGEFKAEMTSEYLVPVIPEPRGLDNSSYIEAKQTVRYSVQVDRQNKYGRRALWDEESKFIDITHSLVCPFVRVNVSAIRIENDSIVATFLYKDKEISVTSTSKISLIDGELRICSALFKRVTRVQQFANQDSLEIAQYYFELFCVSLSVACLLLSFITYCLFPTLRSLPGLNNMGLCIALATAQISLLITVQHGVEGDFPETYCTIHAIILHYSWLAAFMWMSVCCIHMFRVFTCHGTTFTDTRSDKKRYLRYCLFGFGTPVPIVILTIALNLGTTSGDSNGYDASICFLDTRTSILNIVLALLIPLCLMIVSNSVLFILTIREIMYVHSLQDQNRSRESQGVFTYVKLSTLTGIFCIVVVLAVQLQNRILNFLTSPLMALQGVFIFFSFTLNRRVGKLYSDLFNCQSLSKRWHTTSTDTSNDKVFTSGTKETPVSTSGSVKGSQDNTRI